MDAQNAGNGISGLPSMPTDPLFMCGMLATQVAFSHCCPPLTYCLTERSLSKKCPPPHGKILKKGPDQYTKKNQLKVCLHIKFIFLTTPHVVHTCDSVIGHKLNYIYIYISIYNEIYSNQMDKKNCLQKEACTKKLFAMTTTQKKLFALTKSPSPLQKIMARPLV